LAKRLVRLREELGQLAVDAAEIRFGIERVLDLAKECGTSYRTSKSAVRRQWNQAWFQWIEIDVDKDQHSQVRTVIRTPRDHSDDCTGHWIATLSSAVLVPRKPTPDPQPRGDAEKPWERTRGCREWPMPCVPFGLSLVGAGSGPCLQRAYIFGSSRIRPGRNVPGEGFGCLSFCAWGRFSAD
jgi:hypothetical protein